MKTLVILVGLLAVANVKSDYPSYNYYNSYPQQYYQPYDQQQQSYYSSNDYNPYDPYSYQSSSYYPTSPDYRSYYQPTLEESLVMEMLERQMQSAIEDEMAENARAGVLSRSHLLTPGLGHIKAPSLFSASRGGIRNLKLGGLGGIGRGLLFSPNPKDTEEVKKSRRRRSLKDLKNLETGDALEQLIKEVESGKDKGSLKRSNPMKRDHSSVQSRFFTMNPDEVKRFEIRQQPSDGLTLMAIPKTKSDNSPPQAKTPFENMSEPATAQQPRNQEADSKADQKPNKQDTDRVTMQAQNPEQQQPMWSPGQQTVGASRPPNHHGHPMYSGGPQQQHYMPTSMRVPPNTEQSKEDKPVPKLQSKDDIEKDEKPTAASKMNATEDAEEGAPRSASSEDPNLSTFHLQPHSHYFKHSPCPQSYAQPPPPAYPTSGYSYPPPAVPSYQPAYQPAYQPSYQPAYQQPYTSATPINQGPPLPTTYQPAYQPLQNIPYPYESTYGSSYQPLRPYQASQGYYQPPPRIIGYALANNNNNNNCPTHYRSDATHMASIAGPDGFLYRSEPLMNVAQSMMPNYVRDWIDRFVPTSPQFQRLY